MTSVADKNWNNYVSHAEEIARGEGFQGLRDRILELAAPSPDDCVVDVGAGTGLLTLAIASRVEHVWAIDIAPAMCEYLRTKAASGQFQNITPAVGSAESLPLVDGCADAVVSNYCFHHLDAEGKLQALHEVRRVLRPGGRLVFGDMMFALRPSDPRDRRVVADKVRAMLQRGPAGAARLAKNGVRLMTRRWEHPAPASWWRTALTDAGFVDVHVEELAHEGGIASARRQ